MISGYLSLLVKSHKLLHITKRVDMFKLLLFNHGPVVDLPFHGRFLKKWNRVYSWLGLLFS